MVVLAAPALSNTENRTKVLIAKLFGKNILTLASLVFLCCSTPELPLKLPFTLPVHILDAFELNAGAGFLTTALKAGPAQLSADPSPGQVHDIRE